MPATLPYTYCSEADVQAVLSIDGEQGSLDDDNNGVVDTAEQARLTTAINYATAKVMAYCQGLYDVGDLAQSWLVNEWCAILAAHWLRSRRGNPVPDSLRLMLFGDGSEANPGVMGEMRMVKAQQLQLDQVGYRSVPWPAWSNCRVDPRYRLRQLRVERPISEKTPTQYPQQVDWPAEFTFEL